MLSSSPCGIRKGSWTQEEDMLLKKCIEKHGEGKWHQVPLKAGLNRCRKSCRLRWLNHLRPNIKRGAFASDEVDLIIRLHKLLGNGWSLIAGRIPGRTANDVKIFWNSHIQKKLTTTGRQLKEVIKGKGINCELLPENTKSILIKPRPVNFSKHAPPRSSSGKSNNVTTNAPIKIQESPKESEPSLKKPLINLDDDDDDNKWWDDLFCSINEIGIGGTSSFSGIDEEHISTETSPGLIQENLKSSEPKKPSGWGDIPIYADFWDSLNSDQMH